MKNNRKNTLNNAGINSENYFSLRIDRNKIPANSEIVIRVVDKNTGEVLPIKLNEVMDDCFAKNSQFYGQTMSDGNIFNPYIHRRFLPAQFKRNVKLAGYNNLELYVREHYSWNYVVRFLKEECRRLAMLSRRDTEAFDERCRFFTLDTMKKIFYEYANTVIMQLMGAQDEAPKGATYYTIKAMGTIRKEHIRPMRYRFTKFIDSVCECKSYGDLCAVVDQFDFAKLDNEIYVSHRFATNFIASGAYFTIKHDVMFEGLSLNKGGVVEDLKYLRNLQVSEYWWTYRELKL